MAEHIRLGSPLRVELLFVDDRVAADGAESEAVMDLLTVSAKSVAVRKPDGTLLEDETLGVGDPSQGEGYWEAEAGVLDQVGKWTAWGVADGVKSRPVTWFVNP